MLFSKFHHGAIQIVDFCALALEKVLVHRGEVRGILDALVEARHEIALEGDSLFLGHLQAFSGNILFQRIQCRVSHPAVLDSQNRRGSIEHAVHDEFIPRVLSDVVRNMGIETTMSEHIRNLMALLNQGVAIIVVLHLSRLEEHRAKGRDAAKHTAAPFNGFLDYALGLQTILETENRGILPYQFS